LPAPAAALSALPAPAAAPKFTGSQRTVNPVARFGNPLDSGALSDSDLSEDNDAETRTEHSADEILGPDATRRGWRVFKKDTHWYVINPGGETIAGGLAAGQGAYKRSLGAAGESLRYASTSGGNRPRPVIGGHAAAAAASVQDTTSLSSDDEDEFAGVDANAKSISPTGGIVVGAVSWRRLPIDQRPQPMSIGKISASYRTGLSDTLYREYSADEILGGGAAAAGWLAFQNDASSNPSWHFVDPAGNVIRSKARGVEAYQSSLQTGASSSSSSDEEVAAPAPDFSHLTARDREILQRQYNIPPPPHLQTALTVKFQNGVRYPGRIVARRPDPAHSLQTILDVVFDDGDRRDIYWPDDTDLGLSRITHNRCHEGIIGR